MQRITSVLVATALASITLGLVVVAGVTVLWPLHANGVSGSAVSPSYHAFGFGSYHALPAHPTLADLRAAGVRLPQDVVDHRRHVAYVLSGVGVVTLLGLATTRVLGRRPGA